MKLASILGLGLIMLGSVASAQTIATASGKLILFRGDLAGTGNDGKPFEEICDGRLVGIAVRTGGDLHILGKISIALGETSGERVRAVAPICESADGQRRTLAWHGGGGSDAEIMMDPHEPIVAISGTFAGRRENELASLQMHFATHSSQLFGVQAVTTDDHPDNNLFVLTTPHRTVPVGLQGRSGDQISRIGFVYASASDLPAIADLAKDAPPAAADIQEAVDRGVKAKGSTEGASARTPLFSLKTIRFECTVEGPLNQIANDASLRAKRKQAFGVDSVPASVPGVLIVTAQPLDASAGKVDRAAPTTVENTQERFGPLSIEMVSRESGQEHVAIPAYTQYAYSHTDNLDDSGNPFVGIGVTAVFPLPALPPGEFSIRIGMPRPLISIGSPDVTIKIDAKARAKIR